MKKTVLNIVCAFVLLLCGAIDMFAQGRPKLKELNSKKYEQAFLSGVSPWEKKGAYGYADEQGKFFIPPVFRDVMPMGMYNVGFVSYLSEYGSEVWTPISLLGFYLTDLEFDRVVKDFDGRGLAVVRQGNKYGVINHIGKMVANCIYTNFADKGSVYLLYSKSGGCVAIAKDKSEKGYSTYSFAGNEPIVVKAEGGYGIISPNNYFVVADFEYDSVQELVPYAAYCLQKDGKKYLYAGEKLSHGYDDVIPGPGKSYFVVKQNGKYGIVTTQNVTLLSCTQDEMPVLKKGEFSRFSEYGSPVYLSADRRITPSEYDNYLIKKYRDSLADYLLETTLDHGSKQHVDKAVAALYGTKDFARIQHLPEAVEYAESRRFILLSKDNENAKFFDLGEGGLMNADEVLYHAIPSKEGAPAYASCLREGVFGIVDIRSKEEVLPFEYDRIVPLGNGYVSLQKSDSLWLYSVPDAMFLTERSCKYVWTAELDGVELISIRQDDGDNVFNIRENKWVLPAGVTIESAVPVFSEDSLTIPAVVVKKGAKCALYSIRSGEQLTDYLFEDVDPELFAGKYSVVTSAGKKGLYDLAARKYVLSCAYDGIKSYCEFDGDEFVVVAKAGKCGLYNLTESKTVVSLQNDGIDVRDGYVRIQRNEKYAIYSLKYGKMILDSPVWRAELLNDGYMVLHPGAESGCGDGIYNMEYGEWHLDPMDEYTDIYYAGGDMIVINEIGGGNCGIANYKTKKWISKVKGDILTHSYCGNYININVIFDGVDGIYDTVRNKWVLAEVGCTVKSWIRVMVPDGTERYFAVVTDDSKVGLFNLDQEKWVLPKQYLEIVEQGNGVVKVIGEAGGERKYVFDPVAGEFVPEYLRITDRYIARKSGDKWVLWDSRQNKAVSGPCDRISLMYEQK